MRIPRLRKPRFTRSPSDTIRLTGRDIHILDLADRYRVVRSSHLAPLIGGSHQHFIRRVGKLFHAGYLLRPKSQLLLDGQRNAPMAFAITSTGQNALRDNGLPTFATPPRFRSAGVALSLSHSLRVSEIVSSFERCAALEGLRFLPHHEWSGILSRDFSPRRRHLRWRIRFVLDGESAQYGLMPDAGFSIQLPGGLESFFLLEADRGTMPISRRDPNLSSFRKKVIAYKATRQIGVLWRRYQIPGFRVLVVADSAKRLASIRRATAACFQRGDTTMFLFSTATEVAADPFGTWISCAGRKVPLLPGVRPCSW
ncbi:Replication-relaxation [Prosthecobacter debontii]|uniref:Replication-relaxation n=1 Tax=Prosthecobacter debontii TaxID=48467 RepID=A0A1T4X824_9BACT|nr:replication-relaxation family protein [Prosthecobacter debontii]SKA85726.1 Replication-relaxation [Prosthecobacter debontii]